MRTQRRERRVGHAFFLADPAIAEPDVRDDEARIRSVVVKLLSQLRDECARGSLVDEAAAASYALGDLRVGHETAVQR